MNTEIRTITPQDAKDLLLTNSSNRRVRKRLVDKICRDIKSGAWRLTHQGIAIYDDGTLADGQHRLEAIAASGIPCQIMVTYGVPKDEATILAVDSGRSRTVVDSSNISGVTLSHNQVALSKYIEFGIGAQVSLTHYELVEVCKKHSDLVDMANRICNSYNKGVGSAAVKLAFIRAHTLGVPEYFLSKCYEAIKTGVYDGEIFGNVARLYRVYLSTRWCNRTEGEDAYHFTVNALLSTYEGKKLARLSKARKTGDFSLSRGLA